MPGGRADTPKAVAYANPRLRQLRAAPRDRYDEGRAQRDVVRVESHAVPPADAGRPDPLTILAAQDASRLPDVVPLRYGRMGRTPFTFLRGAAAVMASDFWEEMRQGGEGAIYLNFVGSGDDTEAMLRASYGDANDERLVEIKSRFDPTNMFRLNQNIQPQRI